MLKNYAFLCDKNTKEYNNLIKIHTHERLIKEFRIDINLSRNNHSDCLFSDRRREQQRYLGRIDSIGGTRTHFLHCDQQKNCGLIVSVRNKKAGKRMFSGFFISIHSPIHYDSGSGVINL